jgi:substrate import-associated zinc metallohydrolase lipoprotein
MNMKNIKWLFITLIAMSLWSCNEDDLNPNSIFDSEDGFVENAFDTWIYNNYTKPYNIDFKYRFNDKEANFDYNLAPADYTKAVALAKITKHVWVESYEELLGAEFIRTYCPKVMFLVGSVAYNSQGSVVLGTAEGGLKITLYNVNSIDVDNPDLDMLNYWFFHTMHHEFAHILHQTKNYSVDFNLISASNYQSSSWVNISEQNALNMGFVSTYASSETQEDFVEIISIYVTNTKAYWDSLVGRANAEGQSMINQKLDLVKDYLLTTWGINLDDLRDIVLRRSDEILTMDLTTLN